MSTVKSKKLQVGTDATSSNNFTIYQPATPDGTLRIGVGNADSPTEVGRFDSNGCVATNAPVFSAYLGSNQTISNSTSTKLQISTEEFDTNSNFDNATNYRFTPTVTGYYQVNGLVSYGSSASGMGAIFIYKNGVRFKDGVSAPFNSSDNLRVNVSTVVYLNGSTDYIELYTFQNSGGNKDASSYYTYFSSALVRAV